MAKNIEQWGSCKVRVKVHERNYGGTRGVVTVNQYSAESPDNGKRYRLKHIWGDVYEIKNDNGKYLANKHFIDIKSGNEIFGAVWQVRSELKQLPSAYSAFNTSFPNMKIVNAEEFNVANSFVKFGTEFRSFAVPEIGKHTLSWTFYYTNAAMTTGVGTAWHVDAADPKKSGFVYAVFSKCEHEWRALTPEEITENHVVRGRGLSSSICTKCGKIETIDSTD